MTWSSSDDSIATVDTDGLVTAIAPGSAIITATTADGLHTADCNVTVHGLVNAQSPVITAQPQDAQGYLGVFISLSVTAEVADGGTLSYQWYINSANSNTGGSIILWATDSNFDLDTMTVGTATYYYCEVTNTNPGVTGNKTATTVSEVAQVVVI